MEGIVYFTQVTTKVKVVLDGKIAGYIVEVDGGYCYRPLGWKRHGSGDTFEHIWQVKHSIEGVD